MSSRKHPNRRFFSLALSTFIVATFFLLPASQAAARVIRVQLAGSGTGTVIGGITAENPKSIDCGNEGGAPGPSCEHDFGLGTTSIELTATPSTGFEFLGWAGVPVSQAGSCATGTTNPCAVTNLSTSTVTVTATFGIAVQPPEVQIEAVGSADVTPLEATFHGSVNPKGSELKACRFEYLTQAKYQANGNKFTGATQLPCDLGPEEIGEGENFVEVGATAANLEPNTPYRVRLLAEKETLPPVSADAPPFTTKGLAPAITLTEGIANPTLGSLYAVIDPQNDDTTYRFQWGLTPVYDHVTPDDAIPAGRVHTTVVAPIEGLQPQTTYHFRVIAENGTGINESADKSFTTPAPSPARGLELVTSAPKEGADAMAPPESQNRQNFLNNGLVAAGRVAWTDRGVAPNPLPSTGIRNWYTSERDSASGWAVRVLSPPEAAGSTEYRVRAASADLTTAAVLSRTFDFSTGFWGPATLLYRDSSGSFTPMVGGITNPESTLQAVQLSADGSHVVLHTALHLLAADSHEEGANQVYGWTKGNGLSLVGVNSNGSQLSPCGALLAGMGGSSGSVSYPDISADGSRILIQSPDPSMSSPPPGCRFGGAGGNTYVSDLYIREGSTTKDISRSPAGTPDYGAREIGATADLSKIFFVTESALPDDDPATPEKTTEGAGHADLYEYETLTGDLTRLSVAASGGEEDAGVSPIAGNLASAGISSADGSTVYFTAKGQLIPGQGMARAENEARNPRTANLYRWHQGEGLSFVATIAGGSFSGLGRTAVSGPLSPFAAAVNPDGSALVFSSVTRLTAYDNEGTSVIYRYDAESGEVACVSCSPVGAPLYVTSEASPVFHTSFGFGVQSAGGTGGTFLSQLGGLSADGSTVVFASSDPLLPAVRNATTDDNLPVYNVFAWHDGALQLISTGASPSTDMLLGTSASGDDIYFLTAQRLLPNRDPDDAYDIYDARLGGGFPEPSSAPQCEGSECRGGASALPSTPNATSAAFAGPGNLKSRGKVRSCGKGKMRRGKRCISKRNFARRICGSRAGRARRRCTHRQMKRLSRSPIGASRRYRVHPTHRRTADSDRGVAK